MPKQHHSIQQINRLKELRRSIRDGHSTILTLVAIIDNAKAELQKESVLVSHHLHEVKRILRNQYPAWVRSELHCKDFNRNDTSRYIRLLRDDKGNTCQRIAANN